ncbi:MAG: FAD-dependent oxidoreductase [Bryobacteraceae bacterium]
MTPVRGEADVLVAGAGPAGIMAALAAAEDGMKVSLVERHAFVGGNMTTGLPLLGFLSQKGVPVIAGLAQKFIDRLAAVNAASEHRRCPLHVSLTLVDPEAVKSVAMEMLTQRGVEITLHSLVAGVVKDGDVLRGLITEGKGGREALLAKMVIDCSGDGDVAFRAGVPCEKGDAQGGMQPPTLMFCLAGVDTEKLRQSIANQPQLYLADFIPNEYFGRNRKFIVVGLRELIKKAREDGLVIPTERTILITALRDGEVWVNMTRVKGVDGTDTRSLSGGEIEARRQIDGIFKYLTGYVPGFERAYFTKTAPFLGIRETRRITGQYVMTGEDVLGCRRFDDAIAVASYPIDIHRPGDDDCTLKWCGDCYDIPYRSLVPLGVRNLLAAGRCISTTHEAMAAIRVMPTCMATGEAAGRAAALAVRHGVAPSEIDVGELQAGLLAHGAFLRMESAAARE